MASKRYDICTPRKGRDDKTFWTRIGVAWEGDKGIQLVFEALPLPDAEGRCVANLFEPRERDGGQRGGGTPAADWGNKGGDDDGDGIPFVTNEALF